MLKTFILSTISGAILCGVACWAYADSLPEPQDYYIVQGKHTDALPVMDKLSWDRIKPRDAAYLPPVKPRKHGGV